MIRTLAKFAMLGVMSVALTISVTSIASASDGCWGTVDTGCFNGSCRDYCAVGMNGFCGCFI